MKKSSKSHKAVKRILKNKPPCQWIGFLFELQNSLLSCGDFETLSKAGANDLAGDLGYLKSFFDDLAKK